MLSYPADGNQQCFMLEDRSFWFQHRNDCILAAMRRHPPGGPVLDVGGGNGFVTRRMIDEGFPATLLEPGQTGAANAKTQRKLSDVICSTLDDAGFPGNSIAAVGLFDVLEHIPADRAMLASLHEVMRPGGMLYLTVPAFDWLWSSSDVYAGHFRRYSPSGLAELLLDRFDILYSTCFFGALILPILVFRALPFRLGFARRTGVLTAETEHGVKGGGMVHLARRLLAGELRSIETGRALKWGTSLLCVARKKR